MATNAFNLSDNVKAERKLLVTAVNVGTDSAPEWEVIGAGIEDSSVELNPDVSTVTDILGITQRDGSAAFRELVIAPRVPPQLTFARGAVTLPQGRVQVAWTRNGDGLDVEVTLPEQVSCNFEYGGMTRTLSGGRNVFHVKQM